MSLWATWRCAAVHPSTSAPRELPRQRGARRAAIGARAMYGVVVLPASVELRGAARACGHLLRVDGEGYGASRRTAHGVALSRAQRRASIGVVALHARQGRIRPRRAPCAGSREGRGGGGARARRCSASVEWIGALILMVGLGCLPSRLLSSIPLRRSAMVRLRGGDRSLQMVRGKRVEVEQGHTRGCHRPAYSPSAMARCTSGTGSLPASMPVRRLRARISTATT